MDTISFKGHRFPPEIIRHAVWLYARFTLSYRDVEDLLAERGLDISYESVRRWFLKFGAPIARNLRHTRPIPNGKIAGRFEFNEVFSVRGAVSSGFRAPTPGQQNAFNVTTAFIGGQLTNNGVVPSTSAVAIARGGGQLQPEKSINTA